MRRSDGQDPFSLTGTAAEKRLRDIENQKLRAARKKRSRDVAILAAAVLSVLAAALYMGYRLYDARVIWAFMATAAGGGYMLKHRLAAPARRGKTKTALESALWILMLVFVTGMAAWIVVETRPIYAGLSK